MAAVAVAADISLAAILQQVRVDQVAAVAVPQMHPPALVVQARPTEAVVVVAVLLVLQMAVLVVKVF
jgi:hypothetical protein